MKFTHLHVHSHYSLLDGLPKIDALVARTKELGMDSLALTDHGVIYGAVEFFQKAKKEGVKPIIGCEVYVAFEKMDQMRPGIDDKRYHMVLLVRNEKGYKNLVQLVTKAHLEGFYYKPRIDEDLLRKHSDGLIGSSACLAGKIPRLIMSNKIAEAERTALEYQDIFGKGNFYLELQHHPNIREQAIVNKALIELSKKTKIPLIATNDVHYLKPEDADAQDILMLINTGADVGDPERLSLKSDNFSMLSPAEMESHFKDSTEALDNTQAVAAACKFEFELGKTKLPRFEVPDKKTQEEYLKELTLAGLERRFGKNPPQAVLERIDYELKAINELGFPSYFLIVQDFVNWAKQNRIVVGPGRGSAAGSLVSYLLNITNVDPLKHNLLFERFLNPGRAAGLPDIDLDFTDRRRDEVIEYVAQKYGRDRVAQIITFGTMAARAAVRDVGRALGYAYGFCDQIAKMIPFNTNLEDTLKKVTEFKQLYDQNAEAKKLIDFARKLEGVARHASTHACGVVISAEPLSEYTALQHPTQSEEAIVTQYEMHSIEALGLLKMDFLGLKNLTIIEDTLNRIYAIHGKKIDIENIPLDDQKVYKIFQRGATTSIFQVESDGMKRYLKELKPTQFEDIEAMIALYRPGPMELIPSYINRKHGKEKIEYIHPKLEPILKNTYGIILYQEQLMQIAKEMAGFTLSEADVLRKAVGKKIKELLDSQGEKFIDGCIKNAVEKKVAQQLWEYILPFANYGFNKSHSCAYAMIAYQTGYLKTYYPVEFMSAVLTSEKADVERIAVLIDECKKMGIEVLSPDINASFRNFSVIPNSSKILFGLLAIKNVGENIVDAIVTERKANGNFASITDFVTRVASKDLNRRSLESMIKAGAFDKMEERSKLLANLDRMLEWARENQKGKKNGQRGLFERNGNILSGEIKLVNTPCATDFEKLTWEKELLGLYVSSHPLASFKKILEGKVIAISEINENLLQQKVRIGGIVSELRKIITKTGKPMLFMKVEDLGNKIDVVVFPSIIDTNPTVFQENKIVFVTGRVDNRNGERQLIADQVEEIVVSST